MIKIWNTIHFNRRSHLIIICGQAMANNRYHGNRSILCKSIICISIRKRRASSFVSLPVIYSLLSCSFSLSNSSSCLSTCMRVCVSVCNIIFQLARFHHCRIFKWQSSTLNLFFSFLLPLHLHLNSETQWNSTKTSHPSGLVFFIWMLMIIFRYSTILQNKTIAGSGVWSSPSSLSFVFLLVHFLFCLLFSVHCVSVISSDSSLPFWPAFVYSSLLHGQWTSSAFNYQHHSLSTCSTRLFAFPFQIVCLSKKMSWELSQISLKSFTTHSFVGLVPKWSTCRALEHTHFVCAFFSSFFFFALKLENQIFNGILRTFFG